MSIEKIIEYVEDRVKEIEYEQGELNDLLRNNVDLDVNEEKWMRYQDEKEDLQEMLKLAKFFVMNGM